MYCSKKFLLKKGYVLIYTLILGLIILSIACNGFILEEKRRINILKYKESELNCSYNSETTQFLFSEMNAFVNKNLTSFDKLEVQRLFSHNLDGNKIGVSDYCISYFNSVDKFIVKERCSDKIIKSEYYDYNFTGKKLNYIFLYSYYSKGD